jgi:hypothetical protein
MGSVLNDAWEWLYHAEEARKAAERLTDPDAKECMLELGRYFDRQARTAALRARAGDGNFTLAALLGPLN